MNGQAVVCEKIREIGFASPREVVIKEERVQRRKGIMCEME